MVRELGKDEILNRLLEAAAEKWDRAEVEKMRPAFERAAEAVWRVEVFQLKPEEEPAYPTTIFHQGSWRRGKKTGEE
ncbi:MAG: hypothetical protein ACE5Z5_02915 [Candidatus Bathyarchaeia archaeon]